MTEHPYTRSVEHIATVYSLGAPDNPFLRAHRRAEFIGWLAAEVRTLAERFVSEGPSKVALLGHADRLEGEA